MAGESNKTVRTRSKIIQVAKELFVENSFIKTTMENIAKRAELSRRTLYMHFKSKEEILHYVVDDEVNEIIARLERINRSTLPADRRLRLYILTRFNIIDELITKNRYIKYDFIYNQLSVEKNRKPIDKAELLLLTEIITMGKNTGVFACSDVMDFANTIQRMLKTLEQPFILRNNRSRTYKILCEYVDMLFNGILNHKS